MTHVAALEVTRGGKAAATAKPLLEVGYEALTGPLQDHENRGWFPATGGNGDQPGTKAAYAHAFVVLAAASLTRAGHPGGRKLLAEALDVFDTYFWDETEGMAREEYDAAWSACEDYRGVNANMHTVEAMLAAGEVLGDDTYSHRARRIVTRVIDGFARDNDWRLPEHFDQDWNVLLSYNEDKPADQFRPYGVTIGHVLEWARLGINASRALDTPLEFAVPHARSLFEAAITRGWHVDGADGFVYTTDFEDRPIVAERLHWVCCEGISTAWTLYEETGEEQYLEWYERLWDYARRYLLDAGHGGWVHELSPANGPSDTIWWGKPDVYHAYQAALVPLLPGMVSFAGAVASQGS